MSMICRRRLSTASRERNGRHCGVSINTQFRYENGERTPRIQCLGDRVLGLAPLVYSQVPIVVVITLLVQWVFSHAWLRRFRSGPIETLAGWCIHGRRR